MEATMSDDEDDVMFCPLCVEEFDEEDKRFYPCSCGYRVCLWCWHYLRENSNGLCPACRAPYNSDPHMYNATDQQDILNKKEKKMKDRQEKKVSETKTTKSTITDRKLLHNYRVVQRNLVYVIGLPLSIASEETLKKAEYFGQYGKISKVVIHRGSHTSTHSTVSAYVTYTHKEDARAAIQAIDGHWIDNSMLRASFGTTKYCNNFIKGATCNNPDCVYLHEFGDDEDRFTKEEIQSGRTKLDLPVPGPNQMIVTGNGGPSGTGKKPAGEPVFPAPTFVQDIPSSNLSSSSSPRATSGTISSSTSTSRLTSVSSSANLLQSTSTPASSTTASSSSSMSTATTISLVPSAFEPSRDNSANMSSSSGRWGQNEIGSSNPSGSITSSGTGNSDSTASVAGTDSNGVSPVISSNIANNSTTSMAISTLADDQEPALGINSTNDAKKDSTSWEDSYSPLVRLATGNINSKTSDISGSSNNSSSTNSNFPFSSYTGLGYSAVFTVPSSTFSYSIWKDILKRSANNSSSTLSSIISNSDNERSLLKNPYEGLHVSFSELLELTLPPVDAISLPGWPRSHSYYYQGPSHASSSTTSNNNFTISSTPSSVSSEANFSNLGNSMTNNRSAPSNFRSSSAVASDSLAYDMNSKNTMGFSNGFGGVGNNNINNNPNSQSIPSNNVNSSFGMNLASNTTNAINPNNNNGSASIAMLKQIFPTVNLSINSSGTK